MKENSDEMKMNQICLVGDLIIPEIDNIRKKIEADISTRDGDCILDFADVKRVDSSSLSLCLCFLRLAQKQGKQLTFVNVPEEMIAIADLVGLRTILLPNQAN